MKREQTANINYALGWLCGAVFLAAPVIVVIYLFRRKRRLAFQAGIIFAIALPSIIGSRALMLVAGMQRNRAEWLALNVLVLVVFPLIATAVARAISWPRSDGAHAIEL
jgi:hypothetical protein